MADSLFETTTPVIDPDKDYFTELVGEGKRYVDPKAAGRALVEKETFIEALKRENAEMRNELQSRIKMEDVISKLENLRTSPSTDGTPPPEPDTPRSATPEIPDVDAIVDKKLTERERQRQEQRNLMEVKDKLTETFGSDFASRVKQQASALNMSDADMNQIAATNPQAFYRLMGFGQRPAEPFQAPPSGHNPGRDFRPDTGEKKMSYYNKLKKDNPGEYWSTRVQSELHKQAVKLGEAFFDA